jgi:murein L,D-transpeptidase YcbB/YkuD
MFKYVLSFLIIFFSLNILIAEGLAVKTTSDTLSEGMRARIEAERTNKRFICQGELVCGVSIIPVFYEKRGFEPAWCGQTGVFKMADALLEAIRESTREGLRPSDYHLIRLEALVAEVRQKQSDKQPLDRELLVDLDLLMTDAFLLLASHLLAGRVNPETIHTEWVVVNPKIDLAGVLQSALETNQVKAVLNGLRPTQSGYHALKEILQRYRHIAKQGGWPVLPSKASWRKGDHGARYYLLRKRLELSGDLDPAGPGYAYLFDGIVEKAIRQFKKRHGLKSDGIIDEKTLAARNIKVFESWQIGARELDPVTIEWSKVNQDNFSFKFRKEPGPRNDLGRIKFMLPNKFAVYLHDTPHKGLFRKSRRGFSHGCIRVEKAIDLAAYVLDSNPQWTRTAILEAIKTSERQVIRLRNPIPVHVLYWTAWVGQDGLLNFRDDIYERDKPLDVTTA